MKQITTIGKYFRDRFGEKVYKIPISISGFTCPNIDGTVAKGGCTFCENESFSPNLTDKSRFKLNFETNENPHLEKQLLQLEYQFTATKEKLQNKFRAQKFIVYFQSFTNTYAPIDTLKSLYEKALSFNGVVGLSIGTRTDCITDEILDYIKTLSQRELPRALVTPKTKVTTYEVWIEYGIQSVFDVTLAKINRGHSFANVQEWIYKTKQRDIPVCGHIIFGLPDETVAMMLQTVTQVIDLKIDSLKIHPLYVTKNTLLANDYQKGNFTPIDEELYIDMVVKALQMVPESISISRITAGINNDSLLVPAWCKEKHPLINKIKKKLFALRLFY